jgi:hypothetical protein
MPITTEVWAAHIAPNLFPNNEFHAQGVKDDAWVENKTVHRPNEGASPSVEKNRVVTPAVAISRTDADASYDIDEYTSTPTKIRDVETIEVNYDKRSSVLMSHTNELKRYIANSVMYNWAPTASTNIIRTSGVNRPANTPGGTLTRKKITIDDIINARLILDDADVPVEGRCILLPAHMYNDLISQNWTALLQLQQEGKAVLSKSEIGMLHGFNIFQRGKKNTLRYNNAGTPVPIDPITAGGATDNAAALCWHPDFVCRALGEVKVYYNESDALYYGDVISAMARGGGRKVYNNQDGVVSIVEQA